MRVLALDLGTSSVRAQLHDERAEPVGEAARAQYGGEAGLLDPAELLAAAERVLAEARHGEVDAVGASCFWHSLVALDERERPLTPVLTWRDVRSAAQSDALRRRLDPAAVHARTGCPPHPSFWPAKLAWLREEEPQTWARARCFVSVADLLLLRATGELRTSVSMASATGLHAGDGWDAELLAALGVREEQLPPISHERAGEWFPPWGDGACANVGAGCVTPERAALTVGTSAALRIVREDDGAPPRPGLFRYRVDERRVVEGGALSDGGNLHAWLERTLRLPDDLELGAREPDAHGLTFLPLLGGERSPGWHPHARGAVAGLTLETTPADLAQAAYEGVAFRLAEIADLLPEAREFVATGGALDASPAWAQIVADAVGRPVRRGVAEGSLRGAAVLALERLGATPPAPEPGDAFLPRPERAEAYRAARERQRDLYRGVT